MIRTCKSRNIKYYIIEQKIKVTCHQKALDKIQYAFMIETLKKLGIERAHLTL